MNSLRILIVDDSPAMRAYVRRTVQLASLPVKNVFEAANGQEALALVEKENRDPKKLDLIFCDLNMPVMNGEEFVTKLKSTDRDSQIPILIISTDATQRRVMRLRELGAQGYISKPCQPEMIRLKVHQILGETAPAAV
ncbi:MAG: response regulator [Acidobacteria bacterium]|nr:response regulator [Acidobacteriota bacterium]